MSEPNSAAKQLGAMGGKATLKKYGKDHMKNLINKRWAKKKKDEQQLQG